jgi:hypothetical protein
MASNSQILSILVGKPNPLTCAEIAKEMGLKANDVATPLKRMSEKTPPLVSKIESPDGDQWVITEEGKNQITPPTEETEHLTEWQQFNDIGLQIGVAAAQAKLITDHIWTRDWTDLEWVATGLKEQGLRGDVIIRWTSTWRGKLDMPITPKLKEIFDRVKKNEDPTLPNIKDSSQSDSSTVRLRDYIIDGNNNALFVGEGNGDLEYADAVRISAIRAAGMARSGSAGDANKPHSQVDDAIALINAMDKLHGGNGVRKTVMMIPNTAGGFDVQEADAGSTVILPKAPVEENKNAIVPQGAWYMDPNTNEMKQALPGQPIIIYKNPAPSSDGRGFERPPTIVYHDDGTYETIAPGSPVILGRVPAKTAVNEQMFTIPGEEGKPGGAISLDSLDKWLNTKFKLEQHRQTMQHKEETHKMQMDIGKSLRDLATKGVRALGNMNGDEEDETPGETDPLGGTEQQ